MPEIPPTLFLINKLKRGGAEHVFVRQLNALAQRGYPVYLGLIFDTRSSDTYAAELAIPPERTYQGQFRHLGDWSAYRRLGRFISDHHIGVIYSTLESANVVARFTKLFRRRLRAVIRESGLASRKPLRFKALDMILNFLADRIIAVSEAVAQSLRSYQPWHSQKFIVIPNAVPIEPWEEIQRARAALQPSGAPLTVLNVGSMADDNKGQEGLIKALAQLKGLSRLPPFRLVLVGEGRQRLTLKKNALELGLGSAVVFTGQISPSAVRERYLAADIFVLNSKNEGCPNTVLEAMSFGLPVITTRVGGVSEMIVAGESGMIIPVGDNAALEDALRQLMADQSLRRRMGRAGFERVQDKFSLDHQLRQLEPILFNQA